MVLSVLYMLWEMLFSFIKTAKQNQKHSMCPFCMLYGHFIDLTSVAFTGKFRMSQYKCIHNINSRISLKVSDSSRNGHINVRKRAKIRNRYNQAPHLTQDTNGKVTTSQLDVINESQEVAQNGR